MPDYTIKKLSELEDNKITEEFIYHIRRASSNTNEKVPASSPPASVNTTSSELTPPCISQYFTK